MEEPNHIIELNSVHESPRRLEMNELDDSNSPSKSHSSEKEVKLYSERVNLKELTEEHGRAQFIKWLVGLVLLYTTVWVMIIVCIAGITKSWGGVDWNNLLCLLIGFILKVPMDFKSNRQN